jgi:hypothetical protein
MFFFDENNKCIGHYSPLGSKAGILQVTVNYWEQSFRYPHFHVMVDKRVKRYPGRYIRNGGGLKTVCTIRINPNRVYTKDNIVYESKGEIWHSDLRESDMEKLLEHLNRKRVLLGEYRATLFDWYGRDNKPSVNEEWLRDVKGTVTEVEDTRYRNDSSWWEESREFGH